MKQGALLFLSILLLAGCSVSQEVFLSRDGGGNVHIDIELSDTVIAYTRDIYGSFTEDPSEVAVFDVRAIENFFLLNQSAELTYLENPLTGSLSLDVRFRDAEKILDQDAYELQPVITVTEQGSVTTVIFTLTPDNIRILTDPVSLTDTELIQVFGPQAERPYTEDEYLDLISYAFEEYLDDDGAEGMLSRSAVRVKVRTDGKIVNVSGGEKRGGAALFTLPFMDLVTMSEPIVLSVSFR